MPTIELDRAPAAERRKSPAILSLEDRIAANVLWRKGTRATTLMKVFRCSKNTLYYSAISGYSSYNIDGATEVNALVDQMGVQAAWDKYVTDEMVRAVNAENKLLLADKAARRGQTKRAA